MKAGPGRDEPREALGSLRNERRQRPAESFGTKQGELRTAKARRSDRRCYGQALRRWIGALPGFELSSIREATEARGNSAPGRARISRQPIAQGRPSVRRHLYAAVRSPCATHSRSGPRVLVGTRSSLRPLHRGGRKRRAKLGRFMPRECRFVRELRMLLSDRIDGDARCVSLKINTRSKSPAWVPQTVASVDAIALRCPDQVP